MSDSTYVVPPYYEAHIHGFDYAEITPRKAFLVRKGVRQVSRFHGNSDKVAEMSFGEIVNFVLDKGDWCVSV